jgi:hypothetical protein
VVKVDRPESTSSEDIITEENLSVKESFRIRRFSKEHPAVKILDNKAQRRLDSPISIESQK